MDLNPWQKTQHANFSGGMHLLPSFCPCIKAFARIFSIWDFWKWFHPMTSCCFLKWCRGQRRNNSTQWGNWMKSKDCKGASNTGTNEGWSPRLPERWACCRTVFTKCLGLGLVTRQFYSTYWTGLFHNLTMPPAPDHAHCLSDHYGNWQYGRNSSRLQEYQTLKPINKQHKVRSCAASTAKSWNTS